MTRNEELEARAALISATFRDMPSRSFIYDELVKVEREVWEKAIKILDGGRFLADTSPERAWANHVIKVMRQQQEMT